MGESQKQGFQLSFNRFLRVAFQGSRATSDEPWPLDLGEIALAYAPQGAGSAEPG